MHDKNTSPFSDRRSFSMPRKVELYGTYTLNEGGMTVHDTFPGLPEAKLKLVSVIFGIV